MPSTNSATAGTWDGPHSPFVDATSLGTAALSVYQPPGAASPQLWAIWKSTQVDHDGTTGLSYGVGYSRTSGVEWSNGLPIVDTLGNRVQSQYTPALAVLNNQMHLVVVKPDGRGTLAHYVYLDGAGAWEYNTGWVTEPQTSATPSVISFGTSGLLYLAFTTTSNAVSVCTYTPSASGGPKYGTWSAPAATGITSATNAPALFASPQSSGPELHLAWVNSTTKFISEWAMGSSISQWSNVTSSQLPSGYSQYGIGAFGNDAKAILAVPGVVSSSSLWVIIRSKDSQTWPTSWTNTTSLPVANGNVAPIVFDGLLYCFYIKPSGSTYNLVYVTQPI